MGVVVVVVCCLLLAAGVVVAVLAGGGGVAVPVGGSRVARAAWWVSLVWVTGLATGLTVVGPGGRLAMRLLAATTGDDARGRLTEANEVVGEITVEGTVGFFVFAGIVAGVGSTLLWFALRRLLPGGRLAGLAFGAALLVVLGTRNEPLRPGNEDFELLGPWWLSILAFGALVVLQGAAIAGFAAVVSRRLPLPGRRMGAGVLLYAPVLLLVPLFPFGIAALVLVGVLVVASRWSAPAWSVRTGRVLVAAVVLVALPGFVLDLVALAEQGA